MSQFVPYHPAPGIAAFMPGTWTVPENPIEEGMVKYTPHLGEMMAAFFPVPQNPLVAALRGCGMGGCGSCGCDRGCGCGGGLEGLGFAVPSSLTDFWTGLKSGNLTYIAVAGAVIVGGWMLLSGTKRPSRPGRIR